jgi:hypothetical protein
MLLKLSVVPSEGLTILDHFPIKGCIRTPARTAGYDFHVYNPRTIRLSNSFTHSTLFLRWPGFHRILLAPLHFYCCLVFGFDVTGFDVSL